MYTFFIITVMVNAVVDNFFRTMLEYWFQKKNMAPWSTFWFRKWKSERVNCRCSVSPNSMIIGLFGDEVRFYFIVLRPVCSASRCRRSMTVLTKQTTPSAPCRLRTVIKVDWSARQEARMYLCDYLLDKWWLWRTSDFISLFRSLIYVNHITTTIVVPM